MKIISIGVLSLGAALVLMARPGLAAAAEQAPAVHAPEAQQKDPQAVAAAIMQALRATPEITSKEISVTTHAGTIVLSGTAANDLEASKALSVAEKAADGLRVTSSIEVENKPVPSPSMQLVHAVEAELRTDPRTKNLGVTVSIDEQRTIGLHGLVPTGDDRAAALAVASRVKGVQKVQNRLLIPGDPAPAPASASSH